MLIVELWCDQLFNVYVERLYPMEKTCPLFVNHLDHKISSFINNPNNIPVCLHTICHKPFKHKCTQPFLLTNYLQCHLQHALNFHVLGLHVTNCNHHDLIIDRVINVISHGHPSLNSLYVIKHHHTFCRLAPSYICRTNQIQKQHH